MTPREFVDRWAQSSLREQQAAQSHFNELCLLVGHKTPVQADPEGTDFAFEENVAKATGGRGRADVWYRGHFAWEYKGKHRDLDAAYAQLLAYKGGLDNPPLLVVCDFLEYRIYPQWPNTSGLPFVFTNEDLLRPEYQRYIVWLLENPAKFLELRQTELERREKITLGLAEKFAHLADLMRQHTDPAGQPAWHPLQIARFLTRLVFALFAEDIDLMPTPFNQPVFRYLVEGATNGIPETFVEEMRRLFESMDGLSPAFIMKPVPYFNGGLFRESEPGADDRYEILDLTQIPGGIALLGEVSETDWRFVNPSIFGTLFEGALDPSKRAQLGAHYTGESDIRLVVEPVLMHPLYREWDAIRAEAEPLLQTYLSSAAPRPKQTAYEHLIALHDRMMNRLENTRVLDPACGSGNFLYVSLRALKDLESRVRKFFEPVGLPFRDVVTPRQLYGIEKDEFAANLAKVVVWIGYLQWRYEDEGGVLHFYTSRRVPHPRQLPHPILRDKNSPDEPDRIICDDAILRYRPDGAAYEPDWPEVDVIMGNPPFLGDKRMRGELGDAYVDDLRGLYEGHVPGGADLVTYWYEKARRLIERRKRSGLGTRAGFLATQSIRAGANRSVLERIKQTGDIFMAWSDRAWVLKGAAVRISIVGFDDGSERDYRLDDVPVTHLNSDLQNTIDATKAQVLPDNQGFAFQGPVKVGPFEIPDDLARKMLAAVNRSGRSNAEVVRPYLNGSDIVQRPRSYWIIDFGLLSEQEAAAYEMPFRYVEAEVKPIRDENRDTHRREHWWLLGRSGEEYRQSAKNLKRQIFTPRVAKHRIFVWAAPEFLPDSRVYAICRDDDYFFGVLHSTVHESWSVRLASRHGVGNDPTYNAQSCFETFPFPWSPGQEDIHSPRHAAISAAAKTLYAEREAWLNPPDMIALGADSRALKERTLTNLYNALAVHRSGESNGEKLVKVARDFAPRLTELHDDLDRTVLDAYGWGDLFDSLRTEDGDEELLRRLLALNLARAGG
ncbi:MAG: class I SAM-dependent DNA methyltransferase [Anaerolineae bacterium]|nr:class I SAM-dependent DNA methyltransferase [Anaerolineae bacterium]